MVGKELQAQDKYFSVHNSSEQRKCGAVDRSLVFKEFKSTKRRKIKDQIYINKLARIIRKDVQQQMMGVL